MKTVFVVWAPYQRRAEILAEHLGASTKFIYDRRVKGSLGTPARYAAQALQTWRALDSERPDTVFVENPPIFAALVVSLYARRRGARYVIDSHTGAFLSPKWRWSVGLHRLLSKRALTTLVHNASQEKIVKGWRCPYMVIGFTPGSYPSVKEPVEGEFKVAVVSSFREDEPVDQMFSAAALLPEVSFYVTGDSTRVAKSMLSTRPRNCIMTGYLSYERYVGLLRGVDSVMALTTGNDTLLMGAFEAVSVGTPLIVSDSQVLRDYFSLGTVHVRNNVEGIREGVIVAWHERARLQQEILVLRERLDAEWERRFAELRQLLDEK